MLVLIEYPPCSTCQKAKRFLKQKGLAFNQRHIVDNPPTETELHAWIETYNIDIKKLFNTSGKVYRDLRLKDKIDSMTRDALVALLASNGMLIKRPLLIGDDFVLIGFKDAEWEASLS